MKCKCGCGEVTPIAIKTDARRGYKKGEHTRYLPGHVQRTQGKTSAILHQPLPVVDDHEITESRMDNIRAMRDEDAARVLDCRVKAIERSTKRSFIEMGVICSEMKKRELWAVLSDDTGVPFHSWEHWATSVMNVSRRSAFAAVKVIERTQGIAISDLQEMGRNNVTHLARLSTAVQRKLVSKAKTMSEKDFVALVQTDHPDQHLSKAPALILNLSDENRALFDEVIETALWAFEVEGRERCHYGCPDLFSSWKLRARRVSPHHEPLGVCAIENREGAMKHAGGRPPVDERRKAYRKRFSLTEKQSWTLSRFELDRLDRCADDMARRILLKVTSETDERGLAKRTYWGGTRRLGVTRQEYNSGD